MANEAQTRQWNNPRTVDFWKSVEPTVAGLNEPLLNALNPQPGEHLLDVGCGGGLTTLIAARAVAPGGSATGVDISEPLLTLATERAAASTLGNVSFHVADAQAADIAGAPFDAAFSRLGVMFFSDPPVAFANIRRHLKPGGRLVFVCFQSAEINTFYPTALLAKYGPLLPAPRHTPPPRPVRTG